MPGPPRPPASIRSRAKSTCVRPDAACPFAGRLAHRFEARPRGTTHDRRGSGTRPSRIGSAHRLDRPCKGAVAGGLGALRHATRRPEEHTSELQSLLRISYGVFCLKKTTRYASTTHKHWTH